MEEEMEPVGNSFLFEVLLQRIEKWVVTDGRKRRNNSMFVF